MGRIGTGTAQAVKWISVQLGKLVEEEAKQKNVAITNSDVSKLSISPKSPLFVLRKYLGFNYPKPLILFLKNGVIIDELFEANPPALTALVIYYAKNDVKDNSDLPIELRNLPKYLGQDTREQIEGENTHIVLNLAPIESKTDSKEYFKPTPVSDLSKVRNHSFKSEQTSLLPSNSDIFQQLVETLVEQVVERSNEENQKATHLKNDVIHAAKQNSQSNLESTEMNLSAETDFQERNLL